MPCYDSDLNIDNIDQPSGIAIPNFGVPSMAGPDIGDLLPKGMPEDLLELMNRLALLLPSNVLKPQLAFNQGKDVYDAIMKLIDQFMPFLSVYKFFLPILEMIICIIEVLCALVNPIKLIAKLKRLFRICIPQLMTLIPALAFIVMLLSLLFLILELINYLIERILQLVDLLLRNIIGLIKAFQYANEVGVLAIVQKLSEILCGFQNMFVLFEIFKTIIDVIKEILKLIFRIPPCSDSDDESPCCDPEVCPSFIKDNEEIIRGTGSLQYFNRVSLDAGLTSVIPSLPTGFLTTDTRSESWQFFDPQAPQDKEIYNITHAFDLPAGVNTIFFPTDSTYTAKTPFDQAPYTIDLRLPYNPVQWNRADNLGSRFIRIKNCIVLSAPDQTLSLYDNSTQNIPTGVISIQGGLVYEDDGRTPILLNDKQATLNTFIHMNDQISTVPITLEPTDGYQFTNFEYTFKINHGILLGKSLITLGCIPSVSFDRNFINTVYGGPAQANGPQLSALVNSDSFPDLGAAQQCLTNALTGLQNNISVAGVADFQASVMSCLDKLKNDATDAIGKLIDLGFDPYKSTFTINPDVQFTTRTIDVQVALNESSGQSLTSGMPSDSAADLAKKIKPIITFGQISNFSYDGSRFFNAKLSSKKAGIGTIKMTFDGKTFGNVIIPNDGNIPPSIEDIELPYSFVFSPAKTPVSTGEVDTDGQPRRDESDTAEIEG